MSEQQDLKANESQNRHVLILHLMELSSSSTATLPEPRFIPQHAETNEPR